MRKKVTQNMEQRTQYVTKIQKDIQKLTKKKKKHSSKDIKHLSYWFNNLCTKAFV